MPLHSMLRTFKPVTLAAIVRRYGRNVCVTCHRRRNGLQLQALSVSPLNTSTEGVVHAPFPLPRPDSFWRKATKKRRGVMCNTAAILRHSIYINGTSDLWASPAHLSILEWDEAEHPRPPTRVPPWISLVYSHTSWSSERLTRAEIQLHERKLVEALNTITRIVKNC